MPVFRVERNKGYTVMSNYHLRDKSLSLKAKGLLSQILSLPEDWDYTLSGLANRNLRIRSRGRTVLFQRLDESIGMTVTAFRRDDPELCLELECGNRFFQGDITCAACLYYLGLNKSYIEEKQEQQILSQVDRYAICVADLWPVEG